MTMTKMLMKIRIKIQEKRVKMAMDQKKEAKRKALTWKLMSNTTTK